MDEVRFDRWVLEIDRAATEEAYRSIAPGPETCGCRTCRNFAAARERVYPAEFRALCRRLGIQVEREREVYELGRTQDGTYLYGGWFHFVGRLDVTPESQDYQYTDAGTGFTFYFTNSLALVPEAMRERAVVQVEFTARVPWVLDEAAPE